MSLSSRDRDLQGGRWFSRGDRFPAPEWMVEADSRTLEDSIKSLTDAFNDIEAVVDPLIEAGVDYEGYELDFASRQRLSSDFTTLYNECKFLEENYSAKIPADSLTYLKHLRKLCAHRFGSSMDTSMFLYVTIVTIYPMKEPIRSRLYDVLEDNPGTGMYDRVATFNRRPRRWFRKRQ